LLRVLVVAHVRLGCFFGRASSHVIGAESDEMVSPASLIGVYAP